MELIYKDTARRIIDSPRTKEQMLRMLESVSPVQPDHIAEVSKKVDSDLISMADVEQTVEDNILCYTHSDRPIDQDPDTECHKAIRTALKMLRKDLRKLPSAQPEPISESYAKAVMTWLVQYQIKCAELQGRYTPYEVLGWIVNDWRKDNGINQ